MSTSILENIIVTDINKPLVVHTTRGYTHEAHNRPTYGLSLCQSGQITYSMAGEKYVSNPDCAVLLPRNGTYSLYGNKPGIFPLINFQSLEYVCDTIVTFPIRNPQKCLKAFDTLNHLFLYGGSSLAKFEVFYSLLNMISSEATRPVHRLQGINEYIEQNISCLDLTNQALAKHFNISEVYLRKLFLRYYNTTPKQYILDIKIRMAKQLLTDSTFSVTAIAEECGFSNVYYFCKIFREKTGMTPTEYATKNRIYRF